MSARWSSGQVETLLYEAGETLMALRVSGCWPAGYRSSMPEVLRVAVAEYGEVTAEFTISPPSPRQVSAMDRAISWIQLLPATTHDEIRLRKLVWARMLVSPRTRQPIFSWKRLAPVFGVSHPRAKTLWLSAVDRITTALNRPGFCAASGGALRLDWEAIRGRRLRGV